MKKLIVGLGNPDKKYEKTRHNAGFIVIDTILNLIGRTIANKSKLHAHIAEYKDFIFIKPQTYMNDSGIAVSATASYYKISGNNIYIIHDDADIAFGDYKIKFSTGSAGHHGIESIIQSLSTKDFWRVRIGIGREKVGDYDILDWVLTDFNTDELKVIEGLSLKVKDNLEII